MMSFTVPLFNEKIWSHLPKNFKSAVLATKPHKKRFVFVSFNMLTQTMKLFVHPRWNTSKWIYDLFLIGMKKRFEPKPIKIPKRPEA
ncbi:MAG: hypothetical protein ACOC80_07555, partial [Petrotogales bacterium]